MMNQMLKAMMGGKPTNNEGRFVLVTPIGNSPAYLSTDNGSSFNAVLSYAGSAWRTPSISNDGQTIVLPTSTNGLKLSVNGGASFTTAMGGDFSCSGMSGSGQYIVTGIGNYSDNFIHSSNGGVNWNGYTIYGGIYFYIFDIKISDDGQHIWINCQDGEDPTTFYLFHSSNGGTSFVGVFSGSAAYYGPGISSSGQYVYFTDTDGTFYKSSNYGVNWSYPSVDQASGVRNIACSSSGQYVTLAEVYTYGMIKSSNYGTDWSYPMTLPNFMSSAVSKSGKYQYGGRYSTNLLKKSSDYGATWQDTTINLAISKIAISRE